ncbi:MAG: hypothetical protein ABI356_14550 [Steroidobacteraceae bacterium]
MHDALHYYYCGGAQYLALLDHFGNVYPPVAPLDATDIAMRAIEPAREFTLRYAGFCSDIRHYGHDAAVSGRSELF